jgi:hypothetical protein
MMYPFMTLNDKTEVTHSEMRPDGTVVVCVEKPDLRDGFHSGLCTLPGYTWNDVQGFTLAELERYEDLIRSVAHLIVEFSQDGGFAHASGL